MKKIALMLALMIGSVIGVSARDTYAHDASVLPEAAKTTIANNFKSKVSVVKIEKSLGRISEYDVVLTDGTEISFDSKGNWNEVETASSKSVPSSFIPAAIREFVAKNQSAAHVVGISKERNGYDVELSNGVDMKFNKAGEFVRYDY